MNRLLMPLLLTVAIAACAQPELPPAPAPAPAPPATTAAPAAAVCPPPAADAPAPTIGADGDVTHPRLAVATLDDECFDLAQQRGKWVVVNFWATWCKPCLKEIPDLTAFDAARDDVQVIGLAYEEIEPPALREFLVQHPAGYPIAIVDTFSPPADFATPRGLPMTFLIGPDGALAKKFLGPITADDLAAAIADATK